MTHETVRIEPVIGRHLDRLRLMNRRPSSIRHRLEALTRMTRWANGPILYLTEEQLAAWQQDRSRAVSSQTLRVETSHAREFYRWAVKERLIDNDPTRLLVTPSARRGRPHPIQDVDLARAIAEADPQMAATLGLAAFSGFRACEIAQLDWTDLHLTDIPAWVRIQEGKGGHTRDVHVPSALAEILRALPDRSGPVIRPMRGRRRYCTPARISQRANTYLHEDVGVVETLHHLRHRFATRMYAECRDIRAVQEELGHRSPTTTAIYVASSSTTAARAVEAAGQLLTG
jgi:integrase/recombinase XerC